ncbi:MAG: chitin binding domain-containing protein [Thermodesulfovibrionales bacterium]|nr:chitin binding domain-containing protein [Thermodesulfovibrionales bacterium]
MISSLLIGLAVVCLALVLLIYYLSNYVRSETPDDVMRRLWLTNVTNISGFTYRRLGDKYENYTLNDDGKLVQSIDPHPIDYEGEPVDDTKKNHGVIIENDNGFRISGINIDFVCPPPWKYVDGKCLLQSVCNQDGSDHSLYKGIDYYNFTETIATQRAFSDPAVHPRLYYDCGDGGDIATTTERCAENELYAGGVSVDKSGGNPCAIYDICSDRLSMTRHTFDVPGANGGLLTNQYYECRNGISVLNTCPPTTKFSSITNGCLPANQCLNTQNGGTFPISGDDSRYVVCRNGEEHVITCPPSTGGGGGLFGNPNALQCRNPLCAPSENRVEYTNVSYFFYPIAFTSCQPQDNEPTTISCSNATTIVRRDMPIQTNLPYRLPKADLFTPYQQPLVMYDTRTSQCGPFVNSNFSSNSVVSFRFNDGLPYHSQYDVVAFQFVSTLQENEVERRGLDIFDFNGSLVAKSDRYSNFTVLPGVDLSSFEYLPSVFVVSGSTDGYVYMVAYDMLEEANDRSTTNSRHSATNPTTDPQLWYNGFTGEYGTAMPHSVTAYAQLPFLSSFIYQYVIYNDLGDNRARMAVWTRFGAITLEVVINEHAFVDEENLISHKTLPSTGSIVEKFINQRTNPLEGALTGIQNEIFLYQHVPLCLQYVDSYEILDPPDAVTMGGEAIFAVNNSKYLKNPQT